MKANILCALLGVILFASCKKTEVQTELLTNATYSGTFRSTNTNTAINSQDISGNVTLVLNGSAYTCTSPTTNLAASAKGSFAVSGQQYIFRDSLIHPANFDWQVILGGTYNATVKADSLFLTKVVNTGVYSYKLKKQ